MDLEKVTSELFDKTMRSWEDSPNARVEAEACSEMVEESRICGMIATESLRLMAGSVTRGQQLRIMAGIFGYGLRYGWHLRRLLHEREELAGLMTEEDFEMLRREIREAS